MIDPYSHTIRVGEAPDPQPADREILVQVHAAGLNRADLAARAGTHRVGRGPDPLPKEFVGGAEFAGEVLAVGAEVHTWRPGDRVMGQGSGYAELVVIHEDLAMAVPPELTWEEAGGSPVALLTMHDAISTNGRLAPGGTVVMHAATSGVGVVGVRMASELGAGAVIATSRSQSKLDILSKFVGTLACRYVPVDTSEEDFARVVQAETEGRGAEVIVDNVGAALINQNLAAASLTGRIVQVGRVGGRVGEIDLDELARKRLLLIGVTFRTRNHDDRVAVVRRCVGELGARLVHCAPRVDRVYPLSEVAQAQEDLAQDRHVGKLILVP